MQRYFLNISYDGTNYHGWQIQENANTVQTEVEKALSTILRTPTPVHGSGRTDTGVHAIEQVAHLDVNLNFPLEDLPFKLNGVLPDDIVINNARAVKPEAHARFDAIRRSYQYKIHQKRNPFKGGQSYFYSRVVDVEKMNEATELLIGEQDFQSFSKVKTEVNNFICTIEKAEWISENDSLTFHVTANRFLRGMIRALVGTLLEVGIGRMTKDEFSEIIKGKDRRLAGRAVPPEGLYLSAVKYPEEIYLD